MSAGSAPQKQPQPQPQPQPKPQPPSDAVAIIGIGCRFPGDANDPESFWKNLIEGVDAVTDVPEDRWSLRRHFDPSVGTPGRSYARRGGFIRGVDLFEPECFGIAPREAPSVDPQQRMLLETAWEALEDGGVPAERLAGSRTGVFVGISTNDYADIQSTIHDMRSVDAHTATGGAFSIAANRISYCLDLKGPSIAVDTACSSSLVAVHLACRSLSAGECDLALAGGVNIILSPATFVAFSAATMLSPTGSCRAFDAGADGFVRGEGAGMVLLKPLARALADGDPIYAVILATATNQDGRTPGISVPDRMMQEALLREVCGRAGVAPRQIQYLEAHGTGTPVGDPIEANAIGRVVSQGRPAGDPCILGSAKTQIGHLEAAAGIAGLIKTALAIRHRRIPPNLHFTKPNALIPFDDLRIRVATESQPWPHPDAPLFAGVNSFGFGGANAHAILRDPPPAADAQQPGGDPYLVLPITARSPEALEDLARSYREHLARNRAAAAAVCSAACTRRSRHEHGLAVAASGAEGLIDRLDRHLAGERAVGLFAGRRSPAAARGIVFAFCGQGPQWWGMGRQLLECEPVFREKILECDALLRIHADWSLLEEMTAPEASSRMHRTAIAQPALFAIQVALAATWRSHGIAPAALIGHSVGEIAAAHEAGILELAEAARVVYHRGRCMDLASSRGKMLAAAIGAHDAEAMAAEMEGRLSVAASNSPASVTISGEADAVEEFAQRLEERNIWHRMLKVEYAFHSPLMDTIRTELLAALGAVRCAAPRVPMISTVTGVPIGGEALDGDYWWRGLRHRVCFAEAAGHALDSGFSTFLEIGPHPVLSGYINECLQHARARGESLPSLRREEDERAVLHASLGALQILGHEVDWRAHWGENGRAVALPRHPWKKERYWIESPEIAGARVQRDPHPLLLREMRAADPAWQTPLDLRVLRYLADHRVDKHGVFPGAGFVEMALAAAGKAAGRDAVQLEDVQFLRALFLPEAGSDTAVEIRLDEEEGAFQIRSGAPGSGAWTLHCRGYADTERADLRRDADSVESIRSRLDEPLDAATCYERFGTIGLHYGPAFRGIREIVRRDGEALATIRLAEGLDPIGYRLHPALLDAAFQTLFGAVPEGVLAARRTLFLPVYIRKIAFAHPLGAEAFCRARITHAGPQLLEGDLDLYDNDGRLSARIEGFRCQALDRSRAGDPEDPLGWIYEVDWDNRPDAGDLASPRPAAFISSIASIAAAAAADGHAHAAELAAAERPGQAEVAIDRVAAAFIVRALQDLADVAPQHQKLHRRLRGHLERVAPPPGADPDALWREAWGRFPSHATDLILLGRCGRSLGGVLRGEINPLEILFPDGPTTTLATFYQSSPTFRIGNRMIRRAVAAVLGSLPDGAVLRILEVGAGTGALTATLLPLLDPRRTTYHFTDISGSFLAKAEQRFGAHPFVRFHTLDIEKDPAAQGLSPGSFDLVVASDVLHATAEIRTTLANLGSLLAPGGILAVLEAERKSAFADLVFGMVDGWWRFHDFDLRPEHPLLDRSAWIRVLEAAGFEEPTALPYRPGEEESTQIVLLARKPLRAAASGAGAALLASTPAESPPPADESGDWVILDDSGGIGRAVSCVLASAGNRCFQVAPGESPAAALAAAKVKLRGIVHLRALDVPAPDGDSPEPLRAAERASCHTILELIAEMTRLGISTHTLRLILVTRGAHPTPGRWDQVALHHAPLLGIGRVLLNEHPEIRTKLVDLDPAGAGEPAREACRIVAEIVSADPEEEVALRRESRFVPRAVRARPAKRAPNGNPFRLVAGTSGAIDQLSWKEAPETPPGPGMVEIRVVAAGLNFRDVLKALALYPAEADDYLMLGDECAGIVTRVGAGVDDPAPGDEVVAMAPGSFASHVVAPAEAVLKKPRGLAFEEAATIPVTFLTAHYALHEIGRIRSGESVLIHAGAGGVGMAAAQIARHAGAQVFATAGSPEKREVLALAGVDHVLDSRSLAFADEVMRITRGRGVDLVLNSLAGKAIQKGLACLAPFGRFLELGKRDIYANSRMGMLAFRKNLSFHAIDLGRVAVEDRPLLRSMFRRIVERFDAGDYRPLPLTTIGASRAVEAFRHVAQGRHIGKLTLMLADPDLRVEMPPAPPTRFRGDASYLITGGFGGFGLVVARWLAERGARHLILLGRRGGASDEARTAVREIESLGARVLAARGDVADPESLRAVLRDARGVLPPLRGIFHAAMVLDDGIIDQLDASRFSRVMEPKVAGAWNLHRATLGEDLDHFVLFSSVSSWIGTPGQANYVAANAFLDAFAHYRRARGLPALAVNWGRLDEVGYVARHETVAEILSRRGFVGFSPAQAMVGLDRMVAAGPCEMGFLKLDWGATSEVAGKLRIARRVAALFGEIAAEADAEDEGARVRAALRQARPEERFDLVADYIRRQVARVLGASAAKLDSDRPLSQMGFDSLMAVELKNAIDSDLALSLPTGALMEEPSIRTLAEKVAEMFDAGTT